jgi:hypothetical protein
MSNAIALPTIKRTGLRGRPLTKESLRTSVAMVKLRFVKDFTLQAIADKYNEDERFQAVKPRHYTAQAVQGRIDRLKANFPEVFASIVGQVEQAAEQAAPVAISGAKELVTA